LAFADSRDISGIVLDTGKPESVRMAAFEELCALESPEQRVQGLVRIASAKPFDRLFANTAARMLLENPDAEDSIIRTIARDVSLSWDDTAQAAILMDVSPRNPHIYELARTILAARISEAIDPASKHTSSGAISYAVLLLAGSRIDEDLVLDSVREFPEVAQVWLALSKSPTIPAKLVSQGQNLVNDKLQSRNLCVAVATGIASKDPNAAAFAEQAVRKYLEENAHRSMDEIFSENKGDYAPFVMFMRSLDVLSVVAFLNDGTAKDLVFDYVNCKNEVIGEIMGVIAAERWPSELLAMYKPRNDEYSAQVLAAVLFYHPELENQAERIARKNNIAQYAQKLAFTKEHGLIGTIDWVTRGISIK